MARHKTRERRFVRTIADHYILIVCEGVKTEPLYWQSFAVPDSSLVIIDGTGRNTESLVTYALDRKKAGYAHGVPWNEVYAVFDKDSFSDQQFNTAISRCIAKGITPVWSNECFELWFMLHFKRDRAQHRREYYNQYLQTAVPGGYLKNDPLIRLKIRHLEEQAIKNAASLDAESQRQHGQHYSLRNPSTQVHTLVERLRQLEAQGY